MNKIKYDRKNRAEGEIAFFSPSDNFLHNPGLGFIGYVFSEHMHTKLRYHLSSITNDAGQVPTKELIREMAELEFCSVIYLRYEWRDIQKRPGQLELPAAWEWAMEAATDCGKRIAFCIEHSNPIGPYPASTPGIS